MGGREKYPDEVRREVDRLRDERLRDERLRDEPKAADEARVLEAAGWERRGLGPKAIWRRPEGGRWWAHYQALTELRRERLAAEVGPEGPGGAS